MPGIYRPRHPESTVLYRVLFHHFERFLTIPKMLRVFECQRRLLGELCRAAVRTFTVYSETLAGEELVHGIIIAV